MLLQEGQKLANAIPLDVEIRDLACYEPAYGNGLVTTAQAFG